jgi:hypothetical protein
VVPQNAALFDQLLLRETFDTGAWGTSIEGLVREASQERVLACNGRLWLLWFLYVCVRVYLYVCVCIYIYKDCHSQRQMFRESVRKWHVKSLAFARC